MARLRHALSTLRQVPRDTRRKTRFPLLATVRDGIGYPQDSTERFPIMLLTSRPPFSSLPGARTSLIPSEKGKPSSFFGGKGAGWGKELRPLFLSAET